MLEDARTASPTRDLIARIPLFVPQHRPVLTGFVALTSYETPTTS